MTLVDAVKILFGAALGFLISWLHVYLTSRRQKKRAEKLLLIELPTINKAVMGLVGKK